MVILGRQWLQPYHDSFCFVLKLAADAKSFSLLQNYFVLYHKVHLSFDLFLKALNQFKSCCYVFANAYLNEFLKNFPKVSVSILWKDDLCFFQSVKFDDLPLFEVAVVFYLQYSYVLLIVA